MDYLKYLVISEWPIALSALGVLLGAVALVPTVVGIVLSAAALVLAAVMLARDAHVLHRRWSGYEFTTIAAPFPTDEIPPPKSYPSPQYLAIAGRGTALVSSEIDHGLWGSRFDILIQEEPYRLPFDLRATAPHVLRMRTRGRVLFNGPALGLRDDPLVPVGESVSASSIRLHYAKYFDGQCSNELGTVRIRRRDGGATFDLRRRALTTTDGYLTTLAEGRLADIVGISTIAFSSDGYMIVVRQPSRNSASPMLLAPSGSGSLEPRDLLPTAASQALQSVLIRGMERELCEETGLDPESIDRTQVVGFARWMERGARPEFFGLSLLKPREKDLRFPRLKSAERVFSSGVFTAQVDLSKLGGEMTAGVPLAEAGSLPLELREDGSLPLLLAVRAAALWVHHGCRPSGSPTPD